MDRSLVIWVFSDINLELEDIDDQLSGLMLTEERQALLVRQQDLLCRRAFLYQQAQEAYQ